MDFSPEPLDEILPGIYHGMDINRYHSDHRRSSTGVSGMYSTGVYGYRLSPPKQATIYMDEGSLIHTMLETASFFQGDPLAGYMVFDCDSLSLSNPDMQQALRKNGIAPRPPAWPEPKVPRRPALTRRLKKDTPEEAAAADEADAVINLEHEARLAEYEEKRTQLAQEISSFTAANEGCTPLPDWVTTIQNLRDWVRRQFGKAVIQMSQVEMALRVRDNVLSALGAPDIIPFELCTPEVSMFTETDRGRPDLLIPNTIISHKTTGSERWSWDHWLAHAWSNNLPLREAHTRHVIQEVTGVHWDSAWLVISTKPPHQVMLERIPRHMLDRGERQMQEVIEADDRLRPTLDKFPLRYDYRIHEVRR